MNRTQIEEAIAWNGLRAMREAVDHIPTIPEDEDVYLSVTIELTSDTWPDTGPKGRSRSRVIGRAACGYAPATGEGR